MRHTSGILRARLMQCQTKWCNNSRSFIIIVSHERLRQPMTDDASRCQGLITTLLSRAQVSTTGYKQTANAARKPPTHIYSKFYPLAGLF